MGNRNGIQHLGVKVRRCGEELVDLHLFGTQGHTQPGPASQRPLTEGGSLASRCRDPQPSTGPNSKSPVEVKEESRGVKVITMEPTDRADLRSQ